MDKPTLPKLLETLNSVDQQLIDISEDELDIIRQKLPAKVDGVFHFMDACEQRAEVLRKKAKDFLEAAKSLENKRDSVETYIASKMAEHGFERLPGEEYEVALRTTEAVEVDDVEISPEFMQMYEPYLRIKCEISKEALKPALQDNTIDLPFARLKKNNHLKFSVKRKK